MAGSSVGLGGSDSLGSDDGDALGHILNDPAWLGKNKLAVHATHFWSRCLRPSKILLVRTYYLSQISSAYPS